MAVFQSAKGIHALVCSLRLLVPKRRMSFAQRPISFLRGSLITNSLFSTQVFRNQAAGFSSVLHNGRQGGSRLCRSRWVQEATPLQGDVSTRSIATDRSLNKGGDAGAGPEGTDGTKRAGKREKGPRPDEIDRSLRTPNKSEGKRKFPWQSSGGKGGGMSWESRGSRSSREGGRDGSPSSREPRGRGAMAAGLGWDDDGDDRPFSRSRAFVRSSRDEDDDGGRSSGRGSGRNWEDDDRGPERSFRDDGRGSGRSFRDDDRGSGRSFRESRPPPRRDEGERSPRTRGGWDDEDDFPPRSHSRDSPMRSEGRTARSSWDEDDDRRPPPFRAGRFPPDRSGPGGGGSRMSDPRDDRSPRRGGEYRDDRDPRDDRSPRQGGEDRDDRSPRGGRPPVERKGVKRNIPPPTRSQLLKRAAEKRDREEAFPGAGDDDDDDDDKDVWSPLDDLDDLSRPEPRKPMRKPRGKGGKEYSSDPAERLNEQLIDARQVPEVMRAVQDNLDHFNVDNATTAFQRLATVAKKKLNDNQLAALRVDPRLKRLRAIVMSYRAEWSPKTCAVVARGHLIVGIATTEMLEEVVVRAREQLPRIKMGVLAAIAEALAAVGHHDKDFFREVAAAALPLVKNSEFDFRNISNLLWSMGMVGIRTPELLEAATPEIRRLMTGYLRNDEKDLSRLVWALARQQHFEFDFVEDLIARCCEKVVLLNHEYACGMVWGVGQFQIAGTRKTLQEEAGEGAEDPQADPERWQAAVTAARSRQPWADFWRQASGRLWGLGGAVNGVHLPPATSAYAGVMLQEEVLLDLYGARGDDLSQTFLDKGMGEVAQSYTQLRHDHPTLFDAICREGATRFADKKARDFGDAAHLAATLAALAQLGDLPAIGCRNFLAALAELLCGKTAELAQPEKCEALSLAAWGMAASGCLQTRLLKQIRAAVTVQAEHLSPRQLARIYRAELSLRCEAPQIRAALSGNEGDDAYPGLFQDEQLFLRAKEADNSVRLASVTEFRAEVVQHLKEMGLEVAEGHAAGEYTFDAALPDEKIAFQVQGPCDYAYNTLRPLGATAMERRLIRHMGWREAPVLRYHWDELQTPQLRKLYLHSRLKDLAPKLEMQLPQTPSAEDYAALKAVLDSRGPLVKRQILPPSTIPGGRYKGIPLGGAIPRRLKGHSF